MSKVWGPFFVGALALLGVIFGIGLLTGGIQSVQSSNDMIRSVYDRMPDGIRDKVFGFMETLSSPSVISASDWVKEEAAATVEGFILALGPALERATQNDDLDDLTILRQRMMGDREGEDLTRRLTDQVKRDRKLYGPAINGPVTKTLGGPKPKPGTGD